MQALQPDKRLAYYKESGRGRTIVLLHGFLEDQSIWNVVAKNLSRTYRIIQIDLLGHGKTPSKGYVHTMQDMANSVYQILKNLKLRKVTVVGHSMGGYVALALLDKHPDLIKGICLFASTASADSKERRNNRDRAIALVKRNRKVFLHEAIENLFAEENKTRLRMTIKSLKKSAEQIIIESVVNGLEGMKIRKGKITLLQNCGIPCAYILGAHDPVIPLRTMLSEAKTVRAKTYILTGSGHMGIIEEPAESIKYLRKWLRFSLDN